MTGGSRLSPVPRRGSAASSPSASPKRGAKLVVCDIQEDRLAVAVRELREETGMPFLAVEGDLSEPGVADHMVARALDAYGQIDTLVNNAAALIRLRLIDFTEELMQKAVHWNVWNTLRCCKAVSPHMVERRFAASSTSAAKPGAPVRRFTRCSPASAKDL